MIQRKWHDAEEGWLEKAEATQPFGSLVKPDHVAELVSYLLSAQSGVMTGSIIDFDQNVAGSFPNKEQFYGLKSRNIRGWTDRDCTR